MNKSVDPSPEPFGCLPAVLAYGALLLLTLGVMVYCAGFWVTVLAGLALAALGCFLTLFIGILCYWFPDPDVYDDEDTWTW